MKSHTSVHHGMNTSPQSLQPNGPDWSEMHRSPFHSRIQHPYTLWCMSLILLTGLTSCGPAASDPAPNPESNANLGALSEPSLTSAPVPSSRADQPSPAAEGEPTTQPDQLALPVWIAQALDAPDVSVRLHALDTWEKLGSQASLDPLIVALDDADENVRKKAMELIEQHWAIKLDTEPEPGKHHEIAAVSGDQSK